MDELMFPASSSSCPSPASFTTAGHHQELEFVSGDDVLERWLGSDDWLDELPVPTPNGVTAAWGGEGSRSPRNDHLSGEPPAAPGLKRRGRKQGPRTNVPALGHVEAERQRRDKLNRRFCELRAAVPTVSRMDKASVLADATTYIAKLRHRIGQLEAEAKKAAAAHTAVAAPASQPFSSSSLGENGEKLEVQMVGTEAAAVLRLTTTAARHAPARFMLALRSLDLAVQHASVCHVGGVTVQDAVVEVPAALRDDRALRAALLHRLQRAG